jgi:hypothetical protein
LFRYCFLSKFFIDASSYLKTTSFWPRIFLVFFVLQIGLAKASPFIGLNDKQLHHDLQTLSEWGYLDATVTTYPVPWKGVASQVKRLKSADMPYMPAQALNRLKHYLHMAQSEKQLSFFEIQGNSDTPRLTALDGANYHQISATIKHQVLFDQVYVQGAVTIDQDGDVNFDHSLMAYQFENWQVRVGAIEQYWGPSQASSLILSNNARPLPAIAVSRGSTSVSSSPWLSWLGNWYYTGQLAFLESNRTVPNAKLLLNRFTFSPIKRLEIGASWAVMWGGDTQTEGLSEFLKMITFQSTCLKPAGDCTRAEETKQGNHLAGFDLKYSFNVRDRPVTIYAQRIGEDATDNIKITDNANLIGASTYLGAAKIFVETSDTQISCISAESTVTNCFYEHGTYKTGYRYRGRAIGSTFDSDAKQVTLGTNYRFKGGAIAEVLLRKVELNPDGRLPSPVLTDATSEDLLQISGFYQRPIGDWLIKAGGSIEKRDFDGTETQTDASLYINSTYSF